MANNRCDKCAWYSPRYGLCFNDLSTEYNHNVNEDSSCDAFESMESADAGNGEVKSNGE